MAGIGTASAGKATRGSQGLRERGQFARGLRGATTAALLAAMLGLGACGTWADPTQLFGDDSDAPPSAATATSGNAPGSDRFPNLARVPARPVETSTSGERRQALDNLAADRSNSRYTDEELRARPADTTTPPPAPRAPVTQLPAAAPSAQPRGVVEPRPANGQQALQPPPAQMPQAAPGQAQAPSRSANVTDTFSQYLAQSSATTLPAGLPQGGGSAAYSPTPLPGSTQLLAIVRFNGTETALGNDDKALVNKVAEYFKGVGGKGSLRVVSYAPANQGAVSQRRAEQVAAELRRRGIPAAQIRLDSQTGSTAPTYYETAARATDQNRRVEIYVVN